MSYTYTELVDELKTRGMIPTGQNTFTEARFLAGINSTMRTKILPLVMKVRENYYLYAEQFDVNETGEYPIPTRAVGGKLCNVALFNGTERWDLPWISEEQLQDTNVPPLSVPAGCYLSRNIVKIVPKEALGYSKVELSYYLRPAEVVENSDAAQITAIDTATKTLTFASGTIPSSWTTNDTFELVQAEPHFDTLGFALVATTITSTTMIMSATLPTRLAVGDWIGLNNQTPVIQCPLELHPLLAQEVANYCLRGQGDLDAYKAGVEEAVQLRESLLTLISPRIEKEGKKIVNHTGILRRGC